MHSQDKAVEIPRRMVVSETQSSQFIPNIPIVKKEAGQKFAKRCRVVIFD